MSFTTRRALWWGLRRVVAPLAAFVLLATQLVLPSPAEAATITFRSAATAASAAEGVLEITTPEGVEPGDLLLAQVVVAGAPTEIGSPESWTLLRSDTAESGDLTQLAYYRIAALDEPTTHVWRAADLESASGGIAAYAGVDIADPIAHHNGAAAMVEAGNLDAPTVTAAKSNSLLVAAFAIAEGSTLSAPEEMQQRWALSDPAGVLLADEPLATAADSGARMAMTADGSAGIGQLIVLNPATPPPAPPPEESQPTDVPEVEEPTAPPEPEPAEPETARPEYLMEFQAVADGAADFVAAGQGYDIVLEDGTAALTVGKGKSRHEITMTFRGGAAAPEATGVDPVVSATDSQRYTAVTYSDIYPGIDVTYSPDGRQLEYSFVVDPGAEPSTITLEFTGSKGLRIDADGTLVVDSQAGRDLTTTAPVAYQTIADTLAPVEISYHLNDDATLSFAIGDYDTALPLIIDPTFKSVETAGGMRPSGGTLDLDVPPGVVAGDLLVAQVVYNAGGTATITPPAGWNTIDVVTNPSHLIMQGLYWREATASEPGQYSFTVTSGGPDTASGAIAAYGDVDMSDPIDAVAGQANGTSTNVVAPSITTAQPDTSLVAFFAVRDDGTVTPPAGMTERWDINSAAGVGATGESMAAAAEEQLAAAGPTGTRTATAQASDGSIGHLVALAPAATSFTVNSTADVVDSNISDGSCDTGNLVGSDPECTLRAAVQEANASAVDEITLPAGIFTLSIDGPGEDSAATGDIDIDSDITIAGAGVSSTMIDADGIDRVFHVVSGTATLSGATITGGSSSSDGGALLVSLGSSLDVSQAILIANTTSGDGGGIKNDGTLTVTDTEVSWNSSVAGGGLLNNGTATLNRVLIHTNTATMGGGIRNDSNLTVVNSTITGNSGTTQAGALSNTGDAWLTNVTITANDSPLNGGIVDATGAAKIYPLNAIIAGNTSSTNPDATGTIESLGYNFIGDIGDSTGWVGTDRNGIDPLLQALANNGGSTQTHALGVSSPAIDAGNDTACVAPDNDTDQRGAVRPVDYEGDATGPFCDIGAYEAAAPPPPPPATDTITGTVFEDLAGDGLNDGSAGGANNPGLAGVPVSLFVDSAVAQTADSPGEVGQYASIAIGSDGNPVMSYGDISNADLKVLHCDDAACSTYTATTVESAGSVGQYTSLAIGADGFPVISHYDYGNLDLRVYKCSNVACTAGTGSLVDGTGSQGQGSSIAVGTDGLPIISYFDSTSYDLKVAHCNDAACSTSTRTAIDTASTTGVASSITIGSDGLAVISYRYVPAADLKVAHCSNVACTSGTSTVVDTPGDLAGTSSIAQGSDGFPVVAYFDLTNRNLKFAHCTNLTCTTRNITTVDSVGDVGYHPSVAIGLDGNPIIAHWDFSNTALKLTYCDNLDCTSSSSITPDSAGNVGSDPSMVLDAGGNPVVAYQAQGTYDLKILTMGNGVPDAEDTFVSTTTTDANGNYSFSGLSAGAYLVAIESTAISATAGYGGAQTDSWAEQTYGPAGSLCANGSGGTATRGSAGACYGGRDAGTSDSFDGASPDATAAEHIASLSAGGATADFGFSFNTVTNALAGDGRDDDTSANRTVQGSLRQFIQNANAITGPNLMRFVPAVPDNGFDGGGNTWWRISITDALPTLTDAATTIDGTAYSMTDGSTVIDTNTVSLGTAGDVGVGADGRPGTGDEQSVAAVPGPELEIADGVSTGRIARGIDTDADDTTIRSVAIWGFAASVQGGGDGLDITRTGFLLEDAAIGSTAVGGDPGADASTRGLYFDDWSTGTIRTSYIAHALNAGATLWIDVPNWTVEDSHIESNGTNGIIINHTGSITLTRNRFVANGDAGLTSIDPPVTLTVTDNTFTGGSQEGAAIGDINGSTVARNLFENNATIGLWIGAANSAVSDNTIRTNGGDGMFITLGTSTLALNRNLIDGNGGEGVDIYTATGVTLTDNEITGSGTSGVHARSSGAALTTNAIWGNTGPGVVVTSNADQTTLDRNTFGNNGGIAIDLSATTAALGDGITVNTGVPPACGLDAGVGNGGLDAPVVDNATFSTVTGRACAGATVQVYRSVADGDTSDTLSGTDYGEGVEYLGTTTADGAGDWSLTGIAALANGNEVSAIATNGSNDTSEFGANVVVAGPFVVNSTADGSDGNIGDDVCDTGGTVGSDPECTFRAAIEQANASPAVNEIHFDIPTSDGGYNAAPVKWTIYPNPALPATTQPVTLDATTQSGHAGMPVIVLDGSAMLSGENLLTIEGGDSIVRGFAFHNHGDDAIEVEFGDNVTIQGNFVGLEVDGVTAVGTGWGFNIKTNANTIGGPNPGEGNVLAALTDVALESYNGASNNTYQGNKIGTDFSGTVALPIGDYGLDWYGGVANNLFGGTGPGEGNIVANTGLDGIKLTDTGSTGNAFVGNAIYNNGGLGIDLTDDGVTPNDGGDGDTGPNDLLNYPVVTSAVESGGSLSIGFDLDVPSGNYRIEFFSNTGADPSGFGEGESYVDSYDVVGHPGGTVSYVTTIPGSVGDIITATTTENLGASFGSTSEFSATATANGPLVVNSTGDASDNNPGDGICTTGSTIIGGAQECTLRAAIDVANGTPGADIIEFNIPTSDTGYSNSPVSFNVQLASPLPTIDETVTIDASTQPEHTVENRPVVVLDGSTLSAGENALTLDAGSDNSEVRGLVFSWIPGDAIYVESADDVTIAGNYIGTDATGTLDEADTWGLRIRNSDRATIGGTDPADRNVISGNTYGVLIQMSSTDSRIIGNYIGTDATGSADLGNSPYGVMITATGTGHVVGGSTPAERNVISGNLTGVFSSGTGVTISGNYIGTGADGTSPLGNTFGIQLALGATDNTIGGATPGERNVIASNVGGFGIGIEDPATNANTISGNSIGVDRLGAPLGNTTGIRISDGAHHNSIGGTLLGTENTIAHNTSYGVQLRADAGADNAIISNVIHSNGSLGINLGDDNVTPNDPGDIDGSPGPNDYLNFPEIDTAYVTGSIVTLTGTFDVPAGWYRFEFFSNAAADGSGYGEGETLVGSTPMTHTGSGPEPWGAAFPGALGDIVTATLTECTDAACDTFNSTSEFSAAVTAIFGPLVVNSTGDAGDLLTGNGICDTGATVGSDPECTLRAAIEEANAYAGSNTIHFDIPSSDAGYVAGPPAYWSIRPSAALPTITDPVIVDGYSQPGAGSGTTAFPTAFDMVLAVEVNGTLLAGTGTLGLDVNTTGATIRGLAINDFTGVNATGLWLRGGGSHIVQGNFIGTDISGTAAAGNQGYSIFINSPDNLIGGAGPGDGNVVSAGGTYGIRISGSNTVLQGNLVGTDLTGSIDLGHATSGVGVWDGVNITIGGPNPGEGNLVSGNNNHGIWFNSSPNTVTVQGNRIGTDLTGTVAVPNNSGVLINSPNTTFGGTAPGAGNLVSGNTGGGLGVSSLGAGAIIEGNLIGTNAAGTAPLGNGNNGLVINVDDVKVGGTDPAASNVIASSGSDNVVVIGTATNVSILGNHIHSSGTGIDDLGIDLNDDGVTLNDPGDVDGDLTPAPNDLLNFPAITSASETGGFITVDFDLEVPAGWYRVEFFTNTVADASGYGEGEDLTATMTVVHAGGVRSFGTSFLGNAGEVLTATATECTDGVACSAPASTSEFSAAVTVTTNLAPVATDDPPAGSYQVTEGGWGQWDVMGNDSDPNGDTLYLASFTQPSIGSVTRFDSGTPADTSDDFLRFDAPIGPIGPTTFTYTISDGVLTDTGTVFINVNTANNAPVFNQDLTDRTDPEGALVSLSAAASDADAGDTLTYAATDLPLGLSIDTGTGLISGLVNHAAAASSPYGVEITVCDDGSPSRCDTDTFTWTITNVVTTPPYLVAGSGGAGGGDDLLTTADETNFDPATNEVDIGIGTGTSGVAAIAVEPIGGVLFTADGSQLGILNTDGGTFTPVGSGLGTGDGEFGPIAFDAVVGMSFHPLTGEIWAIQNRPGLVDVMFLVDPATGAHIPDAFGAGVDYRKLRQHAGAREFTGLAMDPTDWQLYGSLTDGAGTDYLVSVSRKNGNTKVIGSFTQPITDISFDDTGQLWAIDTGALYQVTKTTAALDAGRTLDNGSSYGALAFVVSPANPPALEGTVFEDSAGDALAGSQAVEDLTNPGVGGVTVHLYRDNGAIPGEPDATDTVFDTKTTGPTGHYYFEAVPPGAFWLAVDSTTIAPIAGGSGLAEQTYGPIGAVSFDGSYTVAATAGPLFGGKQPTVSDNPLNAATSEHLVALGLVTGDHVEDVDLGFSFNVVTNLEGGDGTSPQGSIRRFINNANTVNGPNAMRFVPAVPTTGNDGGGNTRWHLAPTVALDAISGPDTTIDGTAYSDADGFTMLNVNTSGPELELTGSGMGGLGLEVAASRAEVRDLVINGFDSGIAVVGGDGSVIAGNYLGPDATGLVGETGNGDEGVLVSGATNTVIGGTTATDRNVISGNRLRGVFIDDLSDGSAPISDGTQIIGNYIGLDAAGAAALPYSGGATPAYQQIGIAIWSGPDNVVGTPTAGNVISGNEWHGAYVWGVDSTRNKIQGNIFGLDATATNPVPNGYDSATRSAINLTNVVGNLIGGDVPGEGNTIQGNSSNGVAVFGTLAAGNAIVGNSIHNNGELGIDLGTNGVSANDPGDIDTDEPNELLNFPVVTSAIETAGTVALGFELDAPAGNYRIEFFTNAAADPSGYGEGETLAHSYDVGAHPGGLRSYGTTFAGSEGTVITATTTEDLGASYGSTSEFSASVVVTVPDTTAPVITLVGSTPIDVEAGSVHVDAGATAFDTHDGDLTSSIVTTNPVDTAVLGAYVVRYNVTDSSGNAAAEVTRTVNVVDTTAPVISLNPPNPQTIEAGTAYVELGATANDTLDGDLTAAIVINATAVDTSTVGSYTVFYDVTDSTGNLGSAIRTVNVVDTTAPVITLVGSTPIAVEAGSVYVDAGATAWDDGDGDLTSSIVTVNPVDTAILGTYTVTYNVTDTQGHPATEVTRTVNVVDTTAPVITLVGSTPIDVEAGTVYSDAGATAWDNLDGDLTGSIFTVNPVNTAIVGTYTITYTVSDSQGNAATPVTRTVNVVDTTPPVITLVGSSPIDVEAGSVYVDAGATATDSFEGDLTSSIVTVNPVDTAVLGAYVVRYNVTDSSGNAAAEVTRTVNVVDTTAPVISLNPPNPQTIEAGTVYVELGATAWDNLDGDLTGSIVINATGVDTSTVGVYTVFYDVTDSTGNLGSAIRTVNVVDTGAPVITLVGSTPVDVEAGTVYVDAGATAWDDGDGNLTASIVTVNPVDTAILGTYTVTYNVTDSQGHAAAEVTRTVNVIDTTAPVITLNGATPVTVEAGTVYVDAGATASDTLDGDLTAAIVTVNPVDTSTLGTYTVTYNVTDSQGHPATQVTRTVNVIDTTAPVITLVGSTPIDVEAGTVYSDAGATAWDNLDGDLTGSIFTVNPVNTAIVGTYTITYTVNDSQGHPATPVTRIVNVIDTTVPVITLLGASPIDVEAGSVYGDAGATATDSFEGDLTSSIVTVNPVNTAVLGAYVVRYNVTDSSGNAAAEVTRTVNVVDTTAPVISLNPPNPQTIEAGTVYVELGATAWDNLDGDLTGSIVINATGVDTSTVGVYTVFYDVTDSTGNLGSAIRTVNVVDTGAPVITLVGSTPVDVEAGTVYVDAGATASDTLDGDLTAAIVTVNPVDTSTLGTYTVTYNVTDTQGHPATEVTRTVNVVDTTAPVITLVGSTPIDVEAGTVYSDAGATAWDNLDGDLTGSIFTVNPVNTAIVGTYTITYTVSDSQGNAATPVTRTVNVVDTTPPVITLVGSSPIDVEAGSVYGDAGATATDSFEGDLTSSIVTVNPVDTAVLGAYVVRYNVTDSSGNAAAEVTRTVNVVDTTAPVISLNPPNPQTIEAGTVYVELGATAWDNLDGDLTGSIVINATGVDTSTVGVYTVFYDVTDSTGNLGSAIRVVNVVDTTPPVITLNGANPQTIEVGSAYNELGATAWDIGDGDLTAAIVVDSSAVDTTALGTYLVTYDVADTNANPAAQAARSINVVNAPPTLAPIANRTVPEMTALTFSATATDPDPTDPLTYSLIETPSGPSGPAIDPTTGTFTWRPTEAQGPGVFTFDIVVTDSSGLTDQRTVQITVVEAPRPPVLASIADVSVSELTLVSFTAVASDPDVPASAVSYRLVGGPAGAVINPISGVFVWTPTETQGPGVYTFDVVAADLGGLEDRESVTITVTETNVAPVLEPIARQTADEGMALTFTVVATDRDRPVNTLTFGLINPPSGASIDPATGVFTWTPTEGQGPGVHRFSVTVNDNGMVGPAATNASATRTITIDVNETNQPPVVVNPGNQVTTVGTPDSLHLQGSDPDVPANTLTWAARSLPPGLAVGASNGIVTGQPIPGSEGTHLVTVTLSDEHGASDSTTFEWMVSNPPPGAPEVEDDYYTVGFGGILTPPEGVLNNDRDPDGGWLSAVVYTEPTEGSLELNSDGSFTYRHNAHWSGTDRFTYEVEDSNGDLNWADVYITIINQPPESSPDEVTVEEDGYVDFDPVLDNDHDPENYPLVVVDWTRPRNGGITTPTTDKNTLRYKPDSDYHGLDKLTYTVEDPGGLRATATVTITVRPVNDAPTGVDDTYIVEDYQATELNVLANDADIDGDPLRITRVTTAELGTVAILDHRSLSYDPTSGNTGIDTITYTIIDGNGGITNVKATILIPETVLAAGEELFDDIGPNGVEISTQPTQGATIGGFAIQSVTLMADAFWQTVLALRVPMFFLLLALGSVIVGGGLTNAPIFVAARRKRYYAGVLLHREAFLVAYQEPDTSSEIVYRFQPTARSIHAAGRIQAINGTTWIPVTTANGKGWIDTNHLVQEVDIETFMEDERPPQLVADFVQRLRTGQSTQRLLSRDGLLLALAHDVSFIPASMVPRLAARDRADESWSGAIAAFMTAYDATEDISPKTAHSSVALLPSECQNFLYLALEPDALGRPWLVYIEYKNKTPYIIGLGIDL